MITELNLQERRKGIGGSDAAAICGLSKWKTPLDVYNEKINELASVDKNEMNARWFGTKMERIIIEFYSQKTQSQVIMPTDTFIHPKYDFIRGHFDGLVGNRIVEVKNAHAFTAGEWGEENNDSMPTSYVLQCAHYAMILDAEAVDVAVYFGGADFRIYTYNRNKNLEEFLLAHEIKFWHENVAKRIPPEPINLNQALEAWGRLENKEVPIVASAETYIDIAKLVIIKKQMKELQEREEELKFKVISVLKENSILIDQKGQELATWKRPKDAAFFDARSFAKDYPELYKKYYSFRSSSRRLLLKLKETI